LITDGNPDCCERRKRHAMPFLEKKPGLLDAAAAVLRLLSRVTFGLLGLAGACFVTYVFLRALLRLLEFLDKTVFSKPW